MSAVAANPVEHEQPAAKSADKSAVAPPAPDDFPSPANSSPHRELATHFTRQLLHAERLLRYAAERGVEVDARTRNSILEARITANTGWSEKTTAELLTALSTLSAQMKPVTAESLLHFEAKTTLKMYRTWATCLVLVIAVVSFASFFSSALSKSILGNIKEGNELTVKLRTQVEFSTNPSGEATATSQNRGESLSALPPGVGPDEAFEELQSYAHLTRAIYARSEELNWLLFKRVRDPFQHPDPVTYKAIFELPAPLFESPANREKVNTVISNRIRVYQDVRTFGQDVIVDVSNINDALAGVILPMLYALLGTCAYLLRSFSQHMQDRTFIPSHSDSARFLIAAIAGTVVGLFNFTLAEGASASPLAIAFIAGYAVDVFFTFLEGFISAFSTSKDVPATPSVLSLSTHRQV